MLGECLYWNFDLTISYTRRDQFQPYTYVSIEMEQYLSVIHWSFVKINSGYFIIDKFIWK